MPPESRTVSPAIVLKTSGSFNDALSHKSVLEKQRAAIEKLRAHNNKLKEDLLLENKFSVQPSTQSAATLISKLQDEADLYTRKIELEKRKLGMLDQRLDDVTSKLHGARQRMGGINSAKEQSQAMQKQIKILENRLEKAYIKYNEAITHNKQLREQIDNLRRERMMFENISSSLERELQKLKKDMADIIEQTNAAHEAREKALDEIAKLKMQADKEQQGFEDEWKQLTAIIEDDRKARDRQRQKEMAERERKTQELLRNKEATHAQKRKVISGKWGLASKSAIAQNMSMEKMQQYGQAFEKIQQATGIKEIDELVNTFIKAEDQNYTLFNYVNEVHQEIENLEDHISQIKAEIEKHKGEGIELDNQHKRQLKDQEEKLHKMEAQADLFEKRCDLAMKMVSMLKNSVWNLFVKCGCNTRTVRELLGDGGISETNLVAYLGIIEQRTTQLLQTYAAVKDTGATDIPVAELLQPQPLPSSTTRIIIEPLPSTQDEEVYEDGEPVEDDEKPLTREKLESKVQRTLGKKLDTAIKVKPVHWQEPSGKKNKK